MQKPRIIFADEPTGNLDEENVQRVLDVLQDLHRQGQSIVLVTHNPALGHVADRILRLQYGKYLGEEKNQHAMA
ncbi:hypothetical protein [Sodalis sp. (in: enterobacteria)]|uniref:hypothetical protein n=1 Tax=Sodalis sp. (in: enterobacteria) TaxID=1898979 RepID=UPI003F683A9B